MGNCQDQFQNVDQYETNNDKQDALIDRSHKKIFSTAYQKNIGFLINKQERAAFDNEIMHKSLMLNKSRPIEKPIQKRIKAQTQLPKLQPLDLKFYHSLGLPQYVYGSKVQQLKMSKRSQDKQLYIHESQDRVGVIYVGQRNNQGKFHGNGVLKANTVHYIGQFFQGTKHFHGRQIYSNQVYQGQFQYDYRKGLGIRYTPQYIDHGVFDKIILFGKRNYLNGNIYQGQFESNLMHTTNNPLFDEKTYFYDAKNHLKYQDSVLFKEGNLIKAKKVFKKSSSQDTSEGQLIGCYFNEKIISIEDPNYNQIIRNWDQIQNNIDSFKQQKEDRNISQEQVIKRRIQEWE